MDHTYVPFSLKKKEEIKLWSMLHFCAQEFELEFKCIQDEDFPRERKKERNKERDMIVFLWPIRHTINYLNPSTNFSIGKAGAVVSVFASLWRRFRFEARTKNRPGNLLLKI